MSVSAPSYLLQSRHSVFYFRIAVPASIRPVIGKREIRRSLHTKCKREALVRSRQLLESVQYLFTNAFKGNRTNPDNVILKSNRSHARGEGWAKWLHTQGQLLDTNENRLQEASQPAQEITKRIPTFTDILSEYRETQKLEGVSSKTLDDKQSVGNLLVRIVGDLPIDQYGVKECQKFKDTALRLPPLFSRIAKSKPLDQIINEAKETISTTTYNHYIKNLITVFAYAVDEGYCSKNPFLRMKVKQRQKANTYRSILTPKEIKDIFSAVRLSASKNKPNQYWIPFLGFYTGARLNELCQLYLDDIVVVDGIPCIHIREGRADQNLKTPQSERLIPIHSQLQAMGFLEYVQRQRNNGHERLFPELVIHSKHGYSASPSKWFARLRDKLGLKAGDTKKDFHSFRHTVADTLKKKGIPEALVGGLLGHQTGGITFSRYGKDFDPQALLPAVEEIAVS